MITIKSIGYAVPAPEARLGNEKRLNVVFDNGEFYSVMLHEGMTPEFVASQLYDLADRILSKTQSNAQS